METSATRGNHYKKYKKSYIYIPQNHYIHFCIWMCDSIFREVQDLRRRSLEISMPDSWRRDYPHEGRKEKESDHN